MARYSDNLTPAEVLIETDADLRFYKADKARAEERLQAATTDAEGEEARADIRFYQEEIAAVERIAEAARTRAAAAWLLDTVRTGRAGADALKGEMAERFPEADQDAAFEIAQRAFVLGTEVTA